MKTFYRKAIALCLSLAILFLTVGSAAAIDFVEIRGPDYSAEILSEIVTEEATRMDATQFADFYYNIDDNTIIEIWTHE